MSSKYESMFSDAEMYFVSRYLTKHAADALDKEVNDENKFRRQTLYFNDRENPGKIKEIPAWRKSYWIGEYPQATQSTTNGVPTDYAYNYEFTPLVKQVKDRIEKDFNVSFNSCLVGKFINPHDKIGFHSDRSEGMGQNPFVGSISLGKSREFLLKNVKTKEITRLILRHGDLLLMRDRSNVNYLHAVSKDRECSESRYRINLTFRDYWYDDVEREAGNKK